MISNAVNISQLLEFEVAFPGEKPKKPEEYLAGGSRDVILKVAAFFLGFKAINSKYESNVKLLENIFCKENLEFANEVYNRIKVIQGKGKKVGIINPYSSLKLFELFFSKKEEAETQSRTEFERNMFRAYLAINSEFTKNQRLATSSTKELNDEIRIPMMAFCLLYPVSDKMNYEIDHIWATQIIKAVYLFQFLESHPKTQALLKAFLVHFNKQSWKDYLKGLMPLTVSAMNGEREAHTDFIVRPGERFNEDCAFLDKLIVQDNDELDELDFLTLRSTPFYKIKEGVYRMIFNLFVVEKTFKGVYFFLRDINEKLAPRDKIKELKSFYGDEFSEKVLLYNTVEAIYPSHCKKFSGKELTDHKIKAAPDYYVRKGKNILLFEAKDFLIKATDKISFDFSIYEREFERVLYFEDLPDGSIKSKAVLQIVNNIKRLLKKEFEADSDYHYRDIFIYPVLITYDHQYDVPGFNHLLNQWFQEELLELKEEGLFIHHVKPLVVVNIDSLIYHQVSLGRIALHEVIDLYCKQLWSNDKVSFKSKEEELQYHLDKGIPFPLFLDKLAHERKIWDLPPIMDTVGPALFKEEWEARKGNEQKR